MGNLYENIRAKRARGEKPAKKGDADYPDELEKIARDVAEKEVNSKKKKK